MGIGDYRKFGTQLDRKKYASVESFDFACHKLVKHFPRYEISLTLVQSCQSFFLAIYSKIPLLRPAKIKTNSPLKSVSVFKKFQSFFLCFSALSVF